MNYIRLYIKRTFTHNIKKQVFLIWGIAAFVAMLAGDVMRSDANEQRLVNDSRSENYGFSAKIWKCPLEGIDFLENHEEITLVQPVELAEVISGPSGVEAVVSSRVPDGWRMDYLYGGPPGPGEVVLTETAAIGKRQPELGETIRLTVKVGNEERKLDVVVSGVIKGVLFFTDEYAFLYEEDFTKLTDGLSDKERDYDVFVQNVYGDFDQGHILFQMNEMFGTHAMDSSPEMFNRDYDVEWVVMLAMRVVVLCGVCLTAIIYLIIRDDRKTIGIYRTLGAKNYQIVTMVTVRILCSGVIGTALGFLFVVLVESVENLLTTTNTAAIDGVSWQAVFWIWIGVLAALVLLQIPVLHHILRETPVTLLEETVTKGEGLVRLSNPRMLKVKHPLWWYSGLEGKRLKGRQVGIVIISVFAFYLVSEIFLLQDGYMQDGRSEAKEITYTVRKEDGCFSTEELEKLSNLTGLQVEMMEEEPSEPLREVAVALQDTYDVAAKSVEELLPGARLVQDKQYIGNSREELNRETRIAWTSDVILLLLPAVVFMVCYYCFYYLENVEEYRRMYRLGTSLSMIRKIMLFQSLRIAFLIALANGMVGSAAYYLRASRFDGQWLEEGLKQHPVVEIILLVVMVFGVTMGATLFASKQVLRELEQKA
ncbi:MAG: ABC transporter permease [Lachnospiraceae bacterium]|nr:ABC transporter permease [Lachnospiraceae bacterium]